MEDEYFNRTLSDIDIRKIPAPMDPKHHQLYDLFDFYEFTLTAQSFYRNQARHIFSANYQYTVLY